MRSVRFQPPPPSFPCPGGLGVYLGALLHGWGVILGTLSTNQPGSASSSWLAMFPPPASPSSSLGREGTFSPSCTKRLQCSHPLCWGLNPGLQRRKVGY